MNKVTLFLIVLSLVFLASCWANKVYFSELPQEKQDEITKIWHDIISQSFSEIIPLAFDSSLSDEEKDRKSDEIITMSEKRFEEEIIKKYPNVIFWTFEEFNEKIWLPKDNNTKKEEKIIVKKWDNYIYTNNEWMEISVNIHDVINLETREYSDWFYTYDGNNNFVIVRLKWENIWKKVWFISVNEYSIILHTKDWYEYKPSTTIQVSSDSRPDGYVWCIACDMNPWVRWYHDILFDLDINDIIWWELQLSEYDNIFFQL